jgi:hypothetical protein
MYATTEPIKWMAGRPDNFKCHVDGCPNDATMRARLFVRDDIDTSLQVCVCALCAGRIVEDPEGFFRSLHRTEGVTVEEKRALWEVTR